MPTFLACELRPGFSRRNFHTICHAAFSAFGFYPRVALFDGDGFLLHRFPDQALQLVSISLF